MSPERDRPVDLSVVVPVDEPSCDLGAFLKNLVATLAQLSIRFEVLVLSRGGVQKTDEPQADIMMESLSVWGYGTALARGLDATRGEWILTIEPGASHDPGYLPRLWAARHGADLVIASRYVRFGFANMGWIRKIASWAINSLFRRLLSTETRDLTSSFRLYRREALEEVRPRGIDYEALLEVLVTLDCGGSRIREVPIHYRPDPLDTSAKRLGRFGWTCVSSALGLWRLRNSVSSADYDHRAFFSWVIPQRAWQRRRYSVICNLIGPRPGKVVDLGCGTSMIVMGLPSCVAMDIQLKKLRYLRHLHFLLAQGSLADLPFADGSFDTVLCSQVIEHVPRAQIRFAEMNRILRPDGRLILGTPDYGTLSWRVTERLYKLLMPSGYADEHITHFTLKSLSEDLIQAGFRIVTHRYVYKGELVVLAVKY